MKAQFGLNHCFIDFTRQDIPPVSPSLVLMLRLQFRRIYWHQRLNLLNRTLQKCQPSSQSLGSDLSGVRFINMGVILSTINLCTHNAFFVSLFKRLLWLNVLIFNLNNQSHYTVPDNLVTYIHCINIGGNLRTICQFNIVNL